MKKKVYMVTTFILFLILLFKADNCFASNVFTDIRLRDTDDTNLVIDFYAFSDDVNIYGILGTLDYDTNILSLVSCTGMDDFNVVYSDNKILADDYRKHNNFFSFATCTFQLEKDKSTSKMTTVGLKNVTYSDYEQTYFIKDTSLEIDLGKHLTSLVTKDSTDFGQILHTYSPIIFLVIILVISIIAICFVVGKCIKRKKDDFVGRNEYLNSNDTMNLPQSSIHVSVPSENLEIDNSLRIQSNTLDNVSDPNSDLSSTEIQKDDSIMNQDIISPSQGSFPWQENLAEQDESILVASPMTDFTSVPINVEPVTEIHTIEPLVEDISNIETKTEDMNVVISEIEPVIVQDDVSLQNPDIIHISDSVEEEPIKIIPIEENTLEEQVITIPTEDSIEQEQIIVIPTEETIHEESIISIPDEEKAPTFSSRPSYSSSETFQFITRNDSSRF